MMKSQMHKWTCAQMHKWSNAQMPNANTPTLMRDRLIFVCRMNAGSPTCCEQPRQSAGLGEIVKPTQVAWQGMIGWLT